LPPIKSITTDPNLARSTMTLTSQSRRSPTAEIELGCSHAVCRQRRPEWCC